MPAFLDDFEALKRRVAEARRLEDRAEGERQAAARRLQDEFGCADEDAARGLLVRLEAEERKLAAAAGPVTAEFEAEFNATFGGSR